VTHAELAELVAYVDAALDMIATSPDDADAALAKVDERDGITDSWRSWVISTREDELVSVAEYNAWREAGGSTLARVNSLRRVRAYLEQRREQRGRP